MTKFSKSLKQEIADIKKMGYDDIDETGVVDDVNEISTTGGVAGFQTPAAFAHPDETDDDRTKKALKRTGSGYLPAPQYKKNTYKMWEQKLIDESTYRDYRKDTILNPQQKVNTSIHQINSKLFEVEKIIRQNIRLKSEASINRDNYWKSTQNKLKKIHERVLRIATDIQKFGE